jgi:hypothetical protein
MDPTMTFQHGDSIEYVLLLFAQLIRPGRTLLTLPMLSLSRYVSKGTGVRALRGTICARSRRKTNNSNGIGSGSQISYAYTVRFSKGNVKTDVWPYELILVARPHYRNANEQQMRKMRLKAKRERSIIRGGSATAIQTIHRGRSARRRVSRMRNGAREELAEAKAEQVQYQWRGDAAQKRVKEGIERRKQGGAVTEEDEAELRTNCALMLQCAWRQLKAMQHAERIRLAQEEYDAARKGSRWRRESVEQREERERREGREGGEAGGEKEEGLTQRGQHGRKRWMIVEMLARVVNKLRGRAVEGGRVTAVGKGRIRAKLGAARGFRKSVEGIGSSSSSSSSRITPDDGAEGGSGDASTSVDVNHVQLRREDEREDGGQEKRHAPVISFSGKNASSNTRNDSSSGSSSSNTHKNGSSSSSSSGNSRVRRISGSTTDTTAVEAIAYTTAVHRSGGDQLELTDMGDEWEDEH